jgi:hypothetical protein
MTAEAIADKRRTADGRRGVDLDDRRERNDGR